MEIPIAAAIAISIFMMFYIGHRVLVSVWVCMYMHLQGLKAANCVFNAQTGVIHTYYWRLAYAITHNQ